MMNAELLEIEEILTAREFRSLPGHDAGIIRDHAETFMAEISRIEITPALQETPKRPPRSAPGPLRRMRWLNADDQSPFPIPMANVIDWMKAFQPKGAKAADDLEFSDVCPSVGFSVVETTIAAERP